MNGHHNAVAPAAELTADQEKTKTTVGRAIIIGHGFQHLYENPFTVLTLSIYDRFGLGPLSAALISSVRQANQGAGLRGVAHLRQEAVPSVPCWGSSC